MVKKTVASLAKEAIRNSLWVRQYRLLPLRISKAALCYFVQSLMRCLECYCVSVGSVMLERGMLLFGAPPER